MRAAAARNLNQKESWEPEGDSQGLTIEVLASPGEGLCRRVRGG